MTPLVDCVRSNSRLSAVSEERNSPSQERPDKIVDRCVRADKHPRPDKRGRTLDVPTPALEAERRAAGRNQRGVPGERVPVLTASQVSSTSLHLGTRNNGGKNALPRVSPRQTATQPAAHPRTQTRVPEPASCDDPRRYRYQKTRKPNAYPGSSQPWPTAWETRGVDPSPR